METLTTSGPAHADIPWHFEDGYRCYGSRQLPLP